MNTMQSVHAWREAKTLLWRQRGWLAAVFGLVVLNRLSALAVPVVSKTVVDDVAGAKRIELLTPAILLMGGAIALEAATAFGAGRLSEVGAQRAIARLRRELHTHVAGLPLPVLESMSSGALISRLMTAPDHLQLLIGSGMTQLITSLLTACLALGMLTWLSPGLTAGIAVLLLLFGLLLSRAFGRLFPAFQAATAGVADLTGRVADAMSGIRVTKVCVAERQETLRFARESHRLLRSIIQTATGMAAFAGASTLMTRTLAVLIMTVGAGAVAEGSMTLGEVVMYAFLVNILITPLVQIVAISSDAGKAFAALRQVAEIRALTTEAQEDCCRRPVLSLSGRILFENVGFRYPTGPWVLRDLSLLVEPGCTVALVGASGAGKSTICRLVLALDSPTSGRILVDHLDLRELRRRDYRTHVSAVMQDDVLFNDTVANNIRYRQSRATTREVLIASRLAHCDEFVTKLPSGYDTVVGERGFKLSGGQRQRIALARALLANCPILVLDEATSHLDSENDILIRDRLRALRGNRTTLVVAHRLPSIMDADLIVFLENGTIIEQGRHDQLMDLDGGYRRLYQAQLRGGPETSRKIYPGSVSS